MLVLAMQFSRIEDMKMATSRFEMASASEDGTTIVMRFLKAEKRTETAVRMHARRVIGTVEFVSASTGCFKLAGQTNADQDE
jgi:hypothetical protein